MKRLIIALISVTFFFAACQQAQNANHVHEDGTSHDCSEDHSTAGHPPQETFEVKADTAGGQMHHEGEMGHDHGANGHDDHSH